MYVEGGGRGVAGQDGVGPAAPGEAVTSACLSPALLLPVYIHPPDRGDHTEVSLLERGQREWHSALWAASRAGARRGSSGTEESSWVTEFLWAPMISPRLSRKLLDN